MQLYTSLVFEGPFIASKINQELSYCLKKDGFETNNSGVILGGISNGDDIDIFVSLKPTSSISQKTKTVDTENKEVDLQVKGRHDPCVGLRATPILEAMAAMCILDQILLDRGQCFNVDRDL